MIRIRKTAELNVGDRIVCGMDNDGYFDVAGTVAYTYEPKVVAQMGVDVTGFHHAKRIRGIKTTLYTIYKLDDAEQIAWDGVSFQVAQVA